MKIFPAVYYENLKRYWRRRRYQRLNSATNNIKKLKIMKLGGNCHRHWRIRAIPKPKLRTVSPMKLLAKFHDAYINMMNRLAGNIGKYSKNGGVLGGKRSAKSCHMSKVSSGQEVDSRLVMEFYKRWASEFAIPCCCNL